MPDEMMLLIEFVALDGSRCKITQSETGEISVSKAEHEGQADAAAAEDEKLMMDWMA